MPAADKGPVMLRTASFHNLRGRSVFITGGGNGIGAALSEGFLEQGAQVGFVGRKDAGIMGLTRSLAREIGPVKIRVNALAPGWVLTQRQLDLWADPAARVAFMEKQCLKEHIAPVDIVGGVLFLASGLSRMITGQTLVIDAGVVGTG